MKLVIDLDYYEVEQLVALLDTGHSAEVHLGVRGRDAICDKIIKAVMDTEYNAVEGLYDETDDS